MPSRARAAHDSRPVVRAAHSGPADARDVIGKLRRRGLRMRPRGTLKQPFFAVRALRFENQGGDVQLWEFADAKRARVAAAGVDPTGSSIRRGSTATTVEWMAPPHWFRLGRVVALYLGTDAPSLVALRAALGPQFAGR